MSIQTLLTYVWMISIKASYWSNDNSFGGHIKFFNGHSNILKAIQTIVLTAIQTLFQLSMGVYLITIVLMGI
jgi:hypothetical protein